VTVGDFDVDELEREPATVDSKQISNSFLISMRTKLRLRALCRIHARILVPSSDKSSSLLLQQAIRIALGEKVEYTFVDGSPGTAWELVQIDIKSANDRQEGKQLMFAFAAGVLILMATAVYEKFGSQSVEFFGTRVPATPFR